jgi:PAS domain S-box-containing protein
VIAELMQVLWHSPFPAMLQDTRWRIVDVNPAFVAFSGYTREQLIGGDPVALEPEEDRASSIGLRERWQEPTDRDPEPALMSRRIVAADGRNSPAREAAGIKLIGWPYDQMGLVATVEHELAHNGRAEEHFTPSGPFAILPLPGNRSSLVWSERTEAAQRMLALPMDAFEQELKLRFGDHLGEVKLISGRHGYPLAMYLAETFTAPRLALVGDAAHVLHPLAGLGFNLGLRDVAALADCIHDAASLGLDIGSEAVLDRYTQWRRFDTVATGAMMDGMNRLFANTNPVLTLLRRAGLLAVNRMGGLIHSQRVLLALTQAGLTRDDAYRLVQRNAMKVWESDGALSLLDLLKADADVTAALSPALLEEKFDLGYHFKHVDTIFARVFA